MKLLIEALASATIVGILAIFFNPTHLLMPDSVNALLMVGLIVAFLVFIGMVWREKADDERDSVHIQKAGRVSFFIGAAILVVGILYQASRHDIDVWLLMALSGMVLTKLITRIYHNFKN